MTTSAPRLRPQSRTPSIGRRIALGAVATGLLVSLAACGSGSDESSASRSAASSPLASHNASAEQPATTDASALPSSAASSSPEANVGAEQVQIDQGAYVTYTNSSSTPMRFWGFVGRFGEDAVTVDLAPSESTTFWGWNANTTKAAVSMKGLVCLDAECTDGSRIVIMEYSTRTVQAADRKGTREGANLSAGQSQSFTISDQSIEVTRLQNTANKSSQWQVTFKDPA